MRRIFGGGLLQGIGKLLGGLLGGSSPPPVSPPPVSPPPVSPPPVSPPPVSPPPVSPPVPAPNQTAVDLLAAHNQYRAQSGLKPLRLSLILIDVAQAHSVDQANHKNMSHTGSDGSSPFQRMTRGGYQFTMAGENVAMGYTSISSVTKGWINSSGHRANILGDFTEAGFGVAVDSSGRQYWTAVFATPSRNFTRSAVCVESLLPEGLVDPEITNDFSPQT